MTALPYDQNHYPITARTNNCT